MLSIYKFFFDNKHYEYFLPLCGLPFHITLQYVSDKGIIILKLKSSYESTRRWSPNGKK